MFRSLLAFVLVALGLSFNANAISVPTFKYGVDLLNASGEAFQKHVGPGAMDTYMVMTVPYLPTSLVRQQLEKWLPRALKNRGEAHITVITPPEATALKGFVDISEMNDIAIAMQIQNTRFYPACIGRGAAALNGKIEQTYFVVVSAPNLVEIRRAIERLYIARGGNPANFVADHYFPHITLGFTARDLFEQDGVIKDRSSCVAPLSLLVR
jgi:hypothetical protein